jgi:pheromone shutdown-related protein TraB
VQVLELDGREFILVGTAHISRESAQLVREVIERERPDCVCVELDAQRYDALVHRQHWQSLDLREVIRRRQLSALLANLLLGSYQKRLGGALGVTPGAELLEATRTAEECGIPFELCDRDVRVTLRRAWASLSLWSRSKLMVALAASAFERPQVSEQELRELREQDVISGLLRELGEALPGLERVLIDERDAYLAHRMRASPGRRIVAVVGAGHLRGIRAALERAGGVELDVAELERIPPVSPAWRWLGWGIPAGILASVAWIGWTQGAAAAGHNALFWIVATGVPSSIGAALALAHPITIASAFVVAPITSLTPLIGVGHVLALLQAWLRPPMVSELERVADDVGTPHRWWRNRLLRVLLVFVLTTLGGLVGTYVGGYEILSNLF